MLKRGRHAWRRLSLIAIVFVTVASGLACGQSGKTSIAGKITCKGKAVPGMVQFESEADGNIVATAPLGTDGGYKVADIPSGKMRVRIDLSPRHLMNFLPEAEAKEIATKYSQTGGSALNVEVHAGKNEFNADLE